MDLFLWERIPWEAFLLATTNLPFPAPSLPGKASLGKHLALSLPGKASLGSFPTATTNLPFLLTLPCFILRLGRKNILGAGKKWKHNSSFSGAH